MALPPGRGISVWPSSAASRRVITPTRLMLIVEYVKIITPLNPSSSYYPSSFSSSAVLYSFFSSSSSLSSSFFSFSLLLDSSTVCLRCISYIPFKHSFCFIGGVVCVALHSCSSPPSFSPRMGVCGGCGVWVRVGASHLNQEHSRPSHWIPPGATPLIGARCWRCLGAAGVPDGG